MQVLSPPFLKMWPFPDAMTTGFALFLTRARGWRLAECRRGGRRREPRGAGDDELAARNPVGHGVSPTAEV